MMRVGITATRQLDDAGRQNIIAALKCLEPPGDSIVVGGCYGGDQFALEVAYFMGIDAHVVLPEDQSQVDDNWVNFAATCEDGGPYRQRNERIVALADCVWAFPNHDSQRRDPRSGTWMTINIARRAKKPVLVRPQVTSRP